ncbi:alpha/beta-hydrolase [Pleomassaria siparia CBS 279.74]|uniref:Alpha/beta-hydrolase n=1 Tax=Pleomassaria siparia CBS 279.74 TaxID=1314801 RepID=A0A6G1JU01_9PLEO|nr:alpha/beta-hydrolase [Pleomassaria siparia CBS 279.74]
MASTILSLPRPGGAANLSTVPVQGPTEAAFSSTFGALLPPTKYLNTVFGKAAYYEIPPTSPGISSQIPDRVLFIHGVQTPALGMLPLARTLHESFSYAHFVLIDLWGHGLSDTPVVAHDPSLFHGLLDALLDELEWPSSHLVGFSFGGALSVGYTVLRPSRVQSYTLVAPAGLFKSSSLTAEDKSQLHGDDAAAARKWVLEWLEGGELVVPKDWRERAAKGEVVAEAVREWQIREHPGHMATVVGIVRDGGVMDADAEFVKARETGIPTFAVLGGTDGLCGKGDLERVGFMDVAVVPDVGHGVVREMVPEVAELIGDFWSKLNRISH